jgi:two-component system CheB/CheR fusion protein
LKYPELAEDAREILRTLASAEKPVGARDGRWFMVRIMPYRTLDNRIDGVVITFADITVARTLEAKLRGHQSVLEKHFADQSAKLKVAKGVIQADLDARKQSAADYGKTPVAG